jgi:hypothetical protein
MKPINHLTGKPMEPEQIRMVCPFCGHKAETACIGSVHCGPHRLSDGSYYPAVRMVRIAGTVNDTPEN